jgi:hypothetical protein
VPRSGQPDGPDPLIAVACRPTRRRQCHAR